VNSNASTKEIKAAFYQLSKKFHPDMNPDDVHAATKFNRISDAYDILNDPITRREYDNQLLSKVVTPDPFVTYAQRARTHRSSAWKSSSTSTNANRGFQGNDNGFSNSRSTNYGTSDKSQYEGAFGGYRGPSSEDFDEFDRTYYSDFKSWQQMKTEAAEEEEDDDENKRREKANPPTLSKLVLHSLWFSFGLGAYWTLKLLQEMHFQQHTEEFSSRLVTVSKSSRRSSSKF
jgi:curved DNA-binding protein CbpA